MIGDVYGDGGLARALERIGAQAEIRKALDDARADGIRHVIAVADLCALAGLGLRDVVALARSGKSLEAIRADLLERRNRAPDIRGQHVGNFGPATAGMLASRMAARSKEE